MTESAAGPWIDVSVTVRHGMPHWPGNEPIVLERAMDIGRGDDCNVSRLAMGVHSGTHMDGPVHFIHGAAGLDQMPLTATMGETRVIHIADARQVTAEELHPHHLRRGERILFRTTNSERCWQTDYFVEDFVGISEPAALTWPSAASRRSESTTCLSVATPKTEPKSIASCSTRGSGSSKVSTCPTSMPVVTK